MAILRDMQRYIYQILQCSLLYQAYEGGGHIGNSIASIFFGTTAVVEVFNSASCRDNHLMHLICLLVFLVSYQNFWLHALATLRANRTHKQMHYTEIMFSLLSGPTDFTGVTPNSQRASHPVAQNLSWISTPWDSAGQDY